MKKLAVVGSLALLSLIGCGTKSNNGTRETSVKSQEQIVFSCTLSDGKGLQTGSLFQIKEKSGKLSVNGLPFNKVSVGLLFADAEGDERDYVIEGPLRDATKSEKLILQIGTGTYPDAVTNSEGGIECTDNATVNIPLLNKLSGQ